MDREQKKQVGVIVGSLIGALLGAGTAYLLTTPPGKEKENWEPEPVTGRDILLLTGAAATLIRKADDFRRKL